MVLYICAILFFQTYTQSLWFFLDILSSLLSDRHRERKGGRETETSHGKRHKVTKLAQSSCHLSHGKNDDDDDDDCVASCARCKLHVAQVSVMGNASETWGWTWAGWQAGRRCSSSRRQKDLTRARETTPQWEHCMKHIAIVASGCCWLVAWTGYFALVRIELQSRAATDVASSCSVLAPTLSLSSLLSAAVVSFG